MMNKENSTLPSGWQLVTVGEVADLYRGISYKKQQSLNIPQKGYLPILRANNIGKNLNFENLVYVPEFLINRDQMINAGDIIFAMSSGSKHLVGKSAISPIDFPGSFGAFCGLLRPFKKINNQYIAFYFQSNTFRKRISEISKGTNINNLKREHIIDSLLPFPPSNEQHRIVAKIEELFSELDKGVESLTTARKQLALYRQSLLKHAFAGKLTEKWRAEHAGQLETADQLLARIKKEREKRYQQQLTDWEKAVEEWKANGKARKRPAKPRKLTPFQMVTKHEASKLPAIPNRYAYTYLVYLGQLGRGKSKHRPRNDPKLFGGKYPFIQTGEVKGANRIILKYHQTYNETGLKQSKLWPKGTLCITIAANIAETAFLGFDGCFPDSVVGFTAYNEIILPEYVELFIKSIRSKLESFAPATAQKNINLTTLENIMIPYCSLLEQKQIVQIVEDHFFAIEKVEQEIEGSLLLADALRQSILKKAFSGQLVPQNPNDEPASELLARIREEREKIQQETRKRPRKRRKKKEVKTMANLLEIVRAANDWLSAQDAFRQCGIGDGAKTDAIEKIYEELRDNVNNDRIAVERRGDEDWLRAVQRG